MVVLEAATIAAQLGWIKQQQFQKVFKRTWEKAFPDFDMEKVFWQIVYTEGIFVAVSLIWRIGQIWRIFQIEVTGLEKVPEDAYAEAKEYCEEAAGRGAVKRVENCIMQRLREKGYEEVSVSQASFQGAEFLDDIFTGKYLPWVLISIPALFLLLEFKNYKRRKKAKRFFGGK